MRRFVRRPTTAFSVLWLLLLVLVSTFASLMAPYGPNLQDLNNVFDLPSAAHWLGTDQLGRDILSRLIHGGGSTLLGALQAVSIAIALGLPIGMSAGYFGGWVDTLAARYADVLLSIPGIIVLMTALSVFGAGQAVAMTSLGILLSASFLRLARGATIDIRSELYVDAAKVSGVGEVRILVRHLLPHVIAPVSILASISLGVAILIQAGLGFLGLGPPPPAPNWGEMIAEAAQRISSAPWLLVPPGMIIIFTVMALNFLGDAVLDILPQNTRPQLLSLRRTKPAPKQDVRVSMSSLVTTTHGEADPEPNHPDVLLSVRDLTVVFESRGRTFPVVDRINFDIRRGEILGVVGESGCGKTITGLALLGLVPSPGHVENGRIVLTGNDLVAGGEDAFAKIRGTRIGFVAQEPMVALDPSSRIASLLREPLRHHRRVSRRAADALALELLELVGISEPRAIAQKYPYQLSGGMAQRVAIALALTGEPELLIADEPTTALDVTIQAEVLELMRSLQAKLDMSILLVTHDLAVVADICSRVIVMYAGQIVEEGNVEGIFANPLHPYTAALLRAYPDMAGTDEVLATIPGSVPSPWEWPNHCRFADRCSLRIDACIEGPIPIFEPVVGRFSRCLRVDELLAQRSKT